MSEKRMDRCPYIYQDHRGLWFCGANTCNLISIEDQDKACSVLYSLCPDYIKGEAMRSINEDRKIGKGKNLSALMKDKMKKLKNDLLSLKDGWGDNEENKRFSEFFIEKVLSHVEEIVNSIPKGLDLPVISPVDGNTIDIHWKNEKAQLLLNVREIEPFNASIYGHTMNEENEIEWHGYLENSADFTVASLKLLFEN